MTYYAYAVHSHSHTTLEWSQKGKGYLTGRGENISHPVEAYSPASDQLISLSLLDNLYRSPCRLDRPGHRGLCLALIRRCPALCCAMVRRVALCY